MNKLNQLIHSVVAFLLKIFHKENDQAKVESLSQFVRFGIVGLSNTLISYLIYAGTLLIFKHNGAFPHADYLISQTVAFVLSVLWSFLWNNKFVFSLNEGEHRSIIKSLLKTYVSYSFTGLFLNSILLVLWTKYFHISEFVSPILNMIISVPLNFLINKYWAFKKA